MSSYTSPFGERSTADEVVAGLDLTGRRAVVTGGSSGIGVDSARVLAAAGAEVTVAVRDVAAGQRVAQEIRSTVPHAQVAVAALQLDDLASVDAFVAGWVAPLDILINNAGVMNTPQTYTAAGWELQLATNHLGHFALATGLRPALTADARVVSVASSGHDSSPVRFDDLFFLREAYDASVAYGQSKTANVLFAVGAQTRWGEAGITVNACMPGGIWTGLQKHWDPDVLAATKEQAGAVVKTTAQGAATSVLLATDPGLAGYGGRYFEDCHEAAVVDAITDGLHGVRAWALDPVAADRLWDVSTALVDAERRRTRS